MSEVDTLSGDNSTVYTPTTEEIRADYCLLADVSRPRQLQFDRWLAEVKAQAWEEGYNAKWVETYFYDNPYRQGETE